MLFRSNRYRHASYHFRKGPRHRRERLHRCMDRQIPPRGRVRRARHRALGEQGDAPTLALPSIGGEVRDGYRPRHNKGRSVARPRFLLCSLVYGADVVPDLQDDAFTEHVKDVDAIAHTASPFHMRTIEPDEIIRPAVSGTLSVLKAAEAHAQRIKRVIVLSSTAAVTRVVSEPTTLDESSWNEQAIDRKSTRLNSSHSGEARMPSSA